VKKLQTNPLHLTDYKYRTKYSDFLGCKMSKTGKKTSVDRTRLTWVLFALVAAMSVGTVVLDVLEPAKPGRTEKTTFLAAVSRTPAWANISRTSIPIDNDTWVGISIHTLSHIEGDYSLPCLVTSGHPAPIVHFVVYEDGTVGITKAWVDQTQASRSAGKILIGIKSIPGREDATLDQAKGLVALVKYLQSRCNIPAGKVLVHTDSSKGACTVDPLSRYDWRKCLLK
jgi:hypothetical protein